MHHAKSCHVKAAQIKGQILIKIFIGPYIQLLMKKESQSSSMEVF